MKKLIALLVAGLTISVLVAGCSQPSEGDNATTGGTAPATTTGGTAPATTGETGGTAPATTGETGGAAPATTGGTSTGG